MNRKLKIALRHGFNHQSEQGFALPIAIGLGLVMLLVGTTMIIRSQGDQVTASAQKATARSLGTAETGITRVQALLKKFPALTPRNANATNWTEVNAEVASPVSCSGGGGGTTPVATAQDLALISAAANRSWINVDSADLSKGEFQVSSYTVAGGVATLLLEGRARSESGAATTKTGNSTASVQVKIPLEFGINTMWVLGTAGTPVDVSTNNSIQGSVVMAGGSVASYDSSKMSSSKFVTHTPAYTFTANSTPMPGTPEMPGTGVETITISQLSGTRTFPETGDTPSADGKYRYLVNDDLKVSAGANVQVSSGKKVIFYLDKNLDVSGALNDPGSATDLEIYGSSSNNYGSSNLTTDVKFNQGTTHAFIYAPEAKVTVSQGKVNGAIWAKEFTSSSTSLNPIALAQECVGTPLVSGSLAGGGSSSAKPRSLRSWQRRGV